MKNLPKKKDPNELILQIFKPDDIFITILLILGFLMLSESSKSQVAINNSGNSANTNSMLDISSTSKGLLIPRMTTLERKTMEAGLSSADKGMLVYDSSLDFFFYFDGNNFNKISDGNIDVLQDEDGDTKIEVEKFADEDLIRYKLGDTEYFVMHPARIDVLNTGRSVFIGQDAGQNDDLNDNQNIGIGYKSLGSNSTGYYNTGIGSESITRNTTGKANTGVGCQSLFFNTTGQFNTALGYVSGWNIDDGNYNTAIGARALYHNENGHENTAVGLGALHESTGSYNTAIGTDAGNNITSGESNIMIGRSIYAPSATDNYQLNIGNLIFGTDVDGTETTISSGNIGIGNNDPQHKLDVEGDVQLKSTSGNVELFMDGHSGNSEIEFQVDGGFKGSVGYNADNEYLYFYEGGNVVVKDGRMGIGTTNPTTHYLTMGDAGNTGYGGIANYWDTWSDKSLKKDITPIDNPIEKINTISGYYYYWKDGDDKTRQTGVIAQEVEKVLPEIVHTDSEGIKSLDYSKLNPLLIEAVKEQQTYIQELENRISKLEQIIDLKD